jgi:serine protease Do
VGDVITAINGNPVDDVNAFRLQIAGFEPGTTVNLKIARSGQTLTVPVKLGEFDEKAETTGERPEIQGKGEKGALGGVSVEALNSNIREQLQLPEGTAGVIITDVDEDSAASAAGLHSGDVIVQVNHRDVKTVAEFNAAVKAGAARESTLLLVKRGGGNAFVVVPNK